ncbi:MAG TPA: BtaA family protein [Terriglobia bacterium]|nr:BtaA family protein [Terriglobia bacterium]
MSIALSRKLFDQIHSRNLVYNQCWEDPSIDNAVLDIGPGDRIVMITSAGCNALDYLIRDPAAIHCVDVNPHQNALLELKLAAIAALRYQQFFEMFGNGRILEYERIYRDQLRHRLSAASQAIWDRKIHYFDPKGVGLYFSGTAGLVARAMRIYLQRCRGLKDELWDFQRIRDLDEQARFYRTRIAPKLWSPAVRFLIRQPVVLALLGVPAEQIREIQIASNANVSSFIEERVEATLTTIPMRHNYFWRVYINGYYPNDCCPNYLKPEFFQYLRKRTDRIQLHTTTLTNFLRSSAERFSVFVLLDHMDWLSTQPRILEEEWRWIIDRAEPGARIIYRSGSVTCNYIPEFALRRLRFQSDKTRALHGRDRVGTYASFHFATVMP